jgi:hypothetical protein
VKRHLPWIAGVSVLALFALLAWWLNRPEPELPPAPPAPPPQAAPEPPAQKPEAALNLDTGELPLPPRTSTRGHQVFGLNEGLVVPRPGLSRSIGPLEEHTLERRARMMEELGVGLVRLNSHNWPYLNFHQADDDWEDEDLFFELAEDAELDLVVVIGPWPGTRTMMYTASYVPEDMEAYQVWVRELVQRYGDRVLAWEIDNEPDLHNSEPPKAARGKVKPGSFETPAEYAQVVLATSEAIRAADPEAFVLLGGMYRAHTPKGNTYLQQVWERPGVPEAVDGLSLHCYFSSSDLEVPERLMTVARTLAPDKPVWITETSLPSAMPSAPHSDEQWQARGLVALHGELLAQGADRILWHTLVDAQREQEVGPVGLKTNSLYKTALDEDGLTLTVPKPAAATYADLVELLSDQELASLEAYADEDGRMLILEDGWLVYQGSVSTPAGARKAWDLVTGDKVALEARTSAPTWIQR